MQVHTNTYKYTQPHTNTCKYTQINTSIYNYTQIHICRVLLAVQMAGRTSRPLGQSPAQGTPPRISGSPSPSTHNGTLPPSRLRGLAKRWGATPIETTPAGGEVRRVDRARPTCARMRSSGRMKEWGHLKARRTQGSHRASPTCSDIPRSSPKRLGRWCPLAQG